MCQWRHRKTVRDAVESIEKTVQMSKYAVEVVEKNRCVLELKVFMANPILGMTGTNRAVPIAS